MLKGMTTQRNIGVLTIASDICVGALFVGVFILLLRNAAFYPEIAPDESGAFLGLQLLKGEYGFSIDARGASGFSRYYFFDAYPPAYYLFNALAFKLFDFGIVQARGVTAFFLLAMGATCYVFARWRWGVIAGLTVAFLYLHFMPVRVYPWISNRPDITVHFFAILSLVLLSCVDIRRRQLGTCMVAALAGVCYGLGALSHLVGLMYGPAMALVLWWRSGLQFWKVPGFFFYVVGFFTPIACYVVAAWPYLEAISAVVLGYTVSVAPWLDHLNVLRENFPQVLFALVPGAVFFACLSTLAGWWRTEEGEAVLVWGGFAAAAAVAVSFYPNVRLLWFYGLTYMVAAIVTWGGGVGLLVRGVPGRLVAGVIVLALAATLNRGWNAKRAADFNIESTSGIRATQSFEWLGEFREDLAGPVFAPLVFVFSELRDRMQEHRVYSNHGGVIGFDRRVLAAVPSMPEFDEFRAMVIDRPRVITSIKDLLREVEPTADERPEQRLTDLSRSLHNASHVASTRFTRLGLIGNRGHAPGNYSIFRRSEDVRYPMQWPRVAEATPAGVIEFDVASSCATRITQLATPQKVDGGAALWRTSLPVKVPGNEALPILARLEVSMPEVSDMIPIGFATFAPNAEDSAAISTAVESDFSHPFFTGKPLNAVSYIGHGLPDGGRGSDMLLLTERNSAGGTLHIYAPAPFTIDAVNLVLLQPQGQSCTPAGEQKITAIAAAMARGGGN